MGYPETKSTFNLLSVDDNSSDAGILRLCFTAAGATVNFVSVSDVPAAMEFLRKKDRTREPLPDLILLDLNLPKHDGRELLREVKEYPELRQIPIIVLSTSNHQNDVKESYELGANAFVTKPLNLTGFETLVRSIKDFWIDAATLPSRISG